MKQDNFDDLLRSKLGEARIEPPADMWSRIASTLGEQGLTGLENAEAGPAAASRKPAIRRPRRLRWNAAAVAAVLLCALIVGARLLDFGKQEIAEDTTPLPQGIELVSLPQDDTQAVLAETDQTVQEEIRNTVAARMTGQTVPARPSLVAQHIQESTCETPPSATDTAIAGDTLDADPAQAADTAKDIISTGDNNTATTRATTTPKGNDISSDMRTTGAPALPPIAEDRNKRRATPFEIGVYGSNSAGQSTEKNFNTGPLKASSNQVLLFEEGPMGADGITERSPVLVDKLKHRIPVSFGINVTKGIIPRLAVESGVTYSYLHSEREGSSNSATTATYKEKQKLHFVGIPVGVKYNFIDKPWYGIYARGGALFEMCVSGESVITTTSSQYGTEPTEKEKLKINGVLPSVNVHVGAEFNVTRHLGIYIEPGASYYFKDKSGVETYWSENPFNFSIRAGIRIKL